MHWRPNIGPANVPAQIQSGSTAPAAVPYKDYWYWIEDTDITSKRTVTLLMILFSLPETGQPTAAPVVTVPSR
jgi:hypothetical protein